MKMIEFLDTLMTRRSIRSYKSEMVEKEKLNVIVNAGLAAPSGMNKQSAIIIAVTDKTVRDNLSRLNAEVGGFKADFDPFYGAPVLLIVLADKTIPTYIYDGALVMENMLLASHALGLGSCWIHRAKEEFETEYGKQLLKKMGISDDFVGIAHCIVGYPDGDTPKAPLRKENRIFEIK